jgi:parallel beta-helix repeat protein
MAAQKAVLVLFLVFFIVLASVSCVTVVKANPTSLMPQMPKPAFTIKADGSIDPSTAPILRVDDVYTFTDNIVGYTIIVEKDNIVLDGGGYTLTGNGYSSDDDQYGAGHLNAGLFLMNRHGVTVRNMKISGFHDAIYMFSYLGGSSVGNRFEDNLLTDNYYGMCLLYSQSSVLRNNQMKNNTRNLCIIDNVQVSPEPPNLYINDIDSSNSVDGKPVIYWINKHDEIVPSNAGYVALINCSDITVKNLDLSHNGQGILLSSTPNLKITKNHITNTDYGIFLHKSSNVNVTENNLDSNYVCIDIYESSATQISLNSLTRSASGISLAGAQDSVVSGNSIIANTDGGLFLSVASNSTIKHNDVSGNNGTGIVLYASYNNTVAENTVTGNGDDGIGLWEVYATDNLICDNLIANNARFGFLVRYSCNNTITGNMITKNADSAMRFVEGTNNLIYRNNFVENSNHTAQISIVSAFDNPAFPNIWDNGVEGNYWSDSKSSPYFIAENNQDNHPLQTPVNFTPPEIPSIPMQEETTIPTDFPILVIALIATAVTLSIGLLIYFKHKR